MISSARALKRFRSLVGRSGASLTPSARFAPAMVRLHFKVVAVHVGVHVLLHLRDDRDR